MAQVVLPHTFWIGVVAKTAATHEDGKIVWPLGLFIPAANFANICKEDSHHDHTSLPIVGAIIYFVVSNASRAGTPCFLAHCFPYPLDKQSSCSQLPLSSSPLLFQPLHQWLLILFSTVLHSSCTAYTTLQWMKVTVHPFHHLLQPATQPPQCLTDQQQRVVQTREWPLNLRAPKKPRPHLHAPLVGSIERVPG